MSAPRPTFSLRSVRAAEPTAAYYAFVRDSAEYLRSLRDSSRRILEQAAMEQLHADARLLERDTQRRLDELAQLELEVAAFMDGGCAPPSAPTESVEAQSVVQVADNELVEAPWVSMWPPQGHRVPLNEEEERNRGFGHRRTVWNGEAFQDFCNGVEF